MKVVTCYLWSNSRNYLSIILEIRDIDTSRCRFPARSLRGVLSCLGCPIHHFFDMNSLYRFYFLSQVKLLLRQTFSSRSIHIFNNKLIFRLVWFFLYGNDFFSQGCLFLLVHGFLEDILFDCWEWIFIWNINSSILFGLWCLHTNLDSRPVLALIKDSLASCSRYLFLIYQRKIHLFLLKIDCLVHYFSLLWNCCMIILL